MAPRDLSTQYMCKQDATKRDIYGIAGDDENLEVANQEDDNEAIEYVLLCPICCVENAQPVIMTCTCATPIYGHKLCVEAYIQDVGIDALSTCVSCEKQLPLDIKFKPMREVSQH